MVKNIAVIGAGLAGTTIASKMNEKFDVKVFEKSRGVGGRMSTRQETPFIFDHGAQFFKIKTSDFKNFLSELFSQQIIQPWNFRLAYFDGLNLSKIKFIKDEDKFYVGVPNMDTIIKHLSKNCNVILNTKIERIIKENGYEDIAYNELNTRNEFEVRTNTDGTFDIVTLDRNDPSGFRTFASYDNNERAVKIQQELNNKVNTYVNQQTFLEDGVMQNLDITNPFVESFANEVLNTVIDGITFGNIEDAGVSLDKVNELKDIAQSKYFISPEVLKTNLPKKQFDAVMRIKADTLNAKPKKSISSKAFDTLLNDKNIDSNVNTDSFKRLGLQFVGEQNVDKMSIAQKRVLLT